MRTTVTCSNDISCMVAWGLGEQARMVNQLQSSLENGRAGGPPSTDRNELDLRQAFADLKLEAGDDAYFTSHPARQELPLVLSASFLRVRGQMFAKVLTDCVVCCGPETCGWTDSPTGPPSPTPFNSMTTLISAGLFGAIIEMQSS